MFLSLVVGGLLDQLAEVSCADELVVALEDGLDLARQLRATQWEMLTLEDVELLNEAGRVAAGLREFVGLRERADNDDSVRWRLEWLVKELEDYPVCQRVRSALWKLHEPKPYTGFRIWNRRAGWVDLCMARECAYTPQE